MVPAEPVESVAGGTSCHFQRSVSKLDYRIQTLKYVGGILCKLYLRYASYAGYVPHVNCLLRLRDWQPASEPLHPRYEFEIDEFVWCYGHG